MSRPPTMAPSMPRFFARAGVAFLLLTLLWMQGSAWTSYPAASIAQIILNSNAEDWVQTTHNVPGQLTAEVKYKRRMQDQRIATPVATVEPAHYAYGTTLFLALLLASRSRHFFRRALTGYAVLLFPQAISLLFVILFQIIREVPRELLKVAPWQLDGIALGHTFSTLVLPTLAPVALWLWMERKFVHGFAVANDWRTADL